MFSQLDVHNNYMYECLYMIILYGTNFAQQKNIDENDEFLAKFSAPNTSISYS